VGKPEGKRPSGRPRHRRKNNIQIDLQKLVGRTWIRLIWLRIGTRGRFLLTWLRTFGTIKRGEFLNWKRN
jgi:hypothetical protein